MQRIMSIITSALICTCKGIKTCSLGKEFDVSSSPAHYSATMHHGLKRVNNNVREEQTLI